MWKKQGREIVKAYSLVREETVRCKFPKGASNPSRSSVPKDLEEDTAASTVTRMSGHSRIVVPTRVVSPITSAPYRVRGFFLAKI
jgi:hypothetical protein